MKIIIVGALRFSNFGDILFAKLFYNRIQQKHKNATILLYETVFNPVSDFCRNELNYREHFKLTDLRDADILVYISGGYFSNDFEDVKTKLLWHVRYALPGMLFARKKKEIYVLGLGGGDFSWKFSGMIIKQILDNARYVSVRNVETAEKLRLLGTIANIHINSDTAQVISREKGSYCRVENQNKKHIYIHIIPIKHYYSLLKEKVLPAVKEFLFNHEEYDAIVGFDSVAREKYSKYLLDAVDFLGKECSHVFYYDSVEGLLFELGQCGLIITPKLHVGIVSASFGKSVISFPINYEKTHRYFKDIGQMDRCVNIYNVEYQQILDMLERFCNDMIVLPESIIESAEANLKPCDIF